MKKLTMILAVALLPMIGCVNPSEKEGTPLCDENCEETPNNETPNNEVPDDRPVLKGAFIAGHLGNYWDCPEEAYMGPDGADADFAGACAEGTDCTPISSCETAQVTLSLSNGGDETASEILVDTIELFGTDDVSRAVLPLVAVIDTATQLPFDGTLAVGEEVILRVEFSGPYNSWELLQPADGDSNSDRAAGGGGIIKTTLSSENHADLTVVSGEIYDVPSVDT